MDMNGVFLLDAQKAVFSVYREESAIVLRKGCSDWKHVRLISTHKSYQDAREFAELLAEAADLPLRDLTDDRN
jgi:hypothetical protein